MELASIHSISEQGFILLFNPQEAEGDVQRMFRIQIETEMSSLFHFQQTNPSMLDQIEFDPGFRTTT